MKARGWNMGQPDHRKQLLVEMEKFLFRPAADAAEAPRAAGTVFCVKIGGDLPAMAKPPFSGNLGDRIFKNISAQGWDLWEKQATILMNHHNLSMADPEHRHFLMQQMEEFFFGEARSSPRTGCRRARAARAAAAAARERPRHARSERGPAPAGAARRALRARHAPLGIAWPLAFLRRAGLDAETLDLAVEPFSPARAASADVVLISVPMHTALRLGVQAAARIREANPRRPCLLPRPLRVAERGGPAGRPRGFGHPRARARTRWSASCARWPRGVTRPACPASPPAPRPPPPCGSGSPSPSPTAPRCHLRPDTRDTVTKAASTPPGTSRRAAAASTSAGTARSCRSTAGASSSFPAEVVLADVRGPGRGRAPATSPSATPTSSTAPATALARRARAARGAPRVTFDFTAKVEHLLRTASCSPSSPRLGCVFVVSAVESLSDEVLERLDKGHTARRRRGGPRPDSTRPGIALRPTLVPFTPWSTLDDYLERRRRSSASTA